MKRKIMFSLWLCYFVQLFFIWYLLDDVISTVNDIDGEESLQIAVVLMLPMQLYIVFLFLFLRSRSRSCNPHLFGKRKREKM